MVNEQSKSTEQSQIDWNALKPGETGGDYLKLESGKPRVVSFKLNSAKTEPTAFIDPKTNQPKAGVKLVLTLDSLDGAPSSLTFDITAKKSAMQVKAYLDNNMLYTQKFQVTKTGSGTSTSYQWVNLGPK